jgi:hypothetical protein
LFGFEEFEPALRPLMAEVLAEAGVDGACAPVAGGCPWRPLNDAAAVCALAFHGVLKRNVHGGLARGALNALRKLVNDPTLTGKSAGGDDGGGRHPAGFLIGYCLREGLIVDAWGDYHFNGARFAAWSERGVKERMHRLADYAAGYLGGFGIGLLRELLERRRQEERGGGSRWISAAHLVPEGGLPALAGAIDVFEFMGYLHTSRHHGPAPARFAPCGEAGGDPDKAYEKMRKRETVIMPDFSVIIPQEASPSELMDFTKVGLLTAFDKVYKGEITRASVGNSLSMGVDAEQIRHWLRERRAAANVAKTVDEWIREWSRLFVTRDAALVAADERVAKAIGGFEPLRKHLAKVNAHAVFMIRPGSERKVLDTLEKMGFDTRPPGGGEHHDISGKKAADKSAHGGHADAVDAKHDDHQIKILSNDKNKWKPITDFSAAPIVSDDPPPAMRRTKYGSDLKALDVTEMIHVIDYALLTGYSLVIDYAGSAGIDDSIYTVSPLNVDKGIDAAIEAEIQGVRGRKRFYLNKINRMGVAAQ